jgi:ABC-type multidrug transport system permease subunit
MKTQYSFSKKSIYKCIMCAMAGFLAALLGTILAKAVTATFVVLLSCLIVGTFASWQRNKYSK